MSDDELRTLTRALERRRGVQLCSYGNARGCDSLVDARHFARMVAANGGHAFDAAAVERARARVRRLFEATRSYDDGMRSYEARCDYERAFGEYVAHGDLVAALLLEGFRARFEPSDGIGCRLAARERLH